MKKIFVMTLLIGLLAFLQAPLVADTGPPVDHIQKICKSDVSFQSSSPFSLIVPVPYQAIVFTRLTADNLCQPMMVFESIVQEAITVTNRETSLPFVVYKANPPNYTLHLGAGYITTNDIPSLKENIMMLLPLRYY